MPTQEAPQPNWQPISSLPLIATAIDGMLEGAREQYPALEQAKNRPGALDDFTIERVVSVYTQQASDLWLYEEQLRRWKEQKLTQAQHLEVTRLEGQLEQLRAQIDAILSLAKALKPMTIESLMGKSDLEIAIDVLSGKLQLP
ncbi:MAG: hypothetical protein MUD14_08625 [Hydrococcus sp. Prado102]|jgi:hypothetical protein|nr:hypothetical protein [Hydrococcus sp. Prado102]